jgi:Protein of unknown function (DUF3131)
MRQWLHYVSDRKRTDMKIYNFANHYLRFVSTKATFYWFALMPNDFYCQMLRDFAQNLADKNRGYLSGRYENHKLSINT